ncbi:MAG: adenylosuccinate synthase [Bacteroidales bacterium]|nr:adenylosuccinate synthase [Bacteroidales bacterium]
MKVDVLLGLQWGDEGKGKIVDVITPRYDIIARFQGGPNAGHTLEFDGDKHVLHIIPSGIFHSDTINVVGNGVIIDPLILLKEIKGLQQKNVRAENNLYISKKAHLILPSHRLLDAAYENAKGKQKIGSTLKGIGPTYTDKTARIGLRIGDILASDFKDQYTTLKEKHLRIVEMYNFDYSEIKFDGLSFVEYEQKWMEATEVIKTLKLIDSEHFINKHLKEGKSVLAEGAQGTLLDIDFGSYPFVTSSNTVAAGVCSGLGIAPNKIGRILGIVKAYCTRVGSGPFATELFDEDGQRLRDEGHEYGSTTGRPRRCGWLDIPALKYAIMLNGVTDLIVTKADVLNTFESFNICNLYKQGEETFDYIPFEADDLSPVLSEIKGWNQSLEGIKTFEDFPVELKDYISLIEKKTETPVSIISVGPDRNQTIIRDYDLVK